MTERDDIEFDFFDEPATEEETARERRGGRGPRRPVRPPSGLTPLLRLVGLIAFAILLVVLLVFWAQSCRGASKKSEYEDYMEQVSAIAGDSQEVGGDLNRLLTTRGIRQADLEQQLSGLAQRQQQLATAAEELDPPGRLRPQQSDLVEALQFRVSGLRGLENAFRETRQTENAEEAGRLLAEQARRLDTSDVVWDDLFKDPAISELEAQGIGGVEVPDSNFVRNTDLATASSMRQVWQRGRGPAKGTGTNAGGGVHGNGIVRVRVLPSAQELSADEATKIVATTDLAFEVSVENSGDSQEVQIPVTLTIQKSPQPIVKKQTIDLINPGQTKLVVFRDIGQPPFGPQTPVKVEVQPVENEKSKTNNTAEYQVFFSLE